MAQDDIILERIAPGPYNWYRSWGLARDFSDVSRSDIEAISGCSISSETTKVLGRQKSGTIGVTDDAVLVSDGNGISEKIERPEASSGVEIREYRDTAKESALGMASMLSSGIFSSTAVESAEVRLWTGSGDPLELKVEKRTRSGENVVKELKKLFPDASSDGDGGEESAIESLRKRFAEGEISKEEFERRKEILSTSQSSVLILQPHRKRMSLEAR
jgi:hypothetical protein